MNKIIVRDSKTNRRNKITKLIEQILENSKEMEFVWYHVEKDELFIGTPEQGLNSQFYDGMFYGMATYELLGEL